MVKHRKYLVIMLALIMTLMMALPACSGGGSSQGGIQQNVAVGKKCYVDKSGVVFFGYKNLICTGLLKDGEITELMPEGGTTGTIYAMTVYNDNLYISASDGIFRYPLSMFSGGEGSVGTVTKEPLDAFCHFEIFEDKLFFLTGHSLRYVPVDGGEATEVMSGIYDFEVSDKGIYAVNESGGMIIISPELNDSRQAGSIASGVRMTPGGMNLYYRDGGKVMAYSVEKQESAEVGNTTEAYEHYTPWSNGENVMYSDSSFVCHLVTPKGEQEMGKSFGYPGKAEGYVYGDILVGLVSGSSDLCMFDLSTGEMKSYDLEAEMKSYLDKIGGGGDSDPEPQPAPKTGGGAYDITDNFAKITNADGDIQYLYFNDFMLILPNADDITYEAKGDSVDIIFVPGKNAGYGGKLVTIRAYDANDDSYKNLPNYHVGGVGPNTGKRFVAIYPSDLQVSPEFESVVIRYNELKDYLYKIGEGSVNSPLQTADSSPAP